MITGGMAYVPLPRVLHQSCYTIHCRNELLTCLHFDGYVTILALFFGALVYAFAEYVVHRYLPKLVPALYWRHVEHHKHPQELKYLFSPVYHDVLIYSAYIPLVWF